MRLQLTLRQYAHTFTATGQRYVCTYQRRLALSLEKMSSSLLQLGDTIWGGQIFLHRNGLLASAKNCSRLAMFVRSDLCIKYYRCRVPMQECVQSDVSDGVSWYCSQCYTPRTCSVACLPGPHFCGVYMRALTTQRRSELLDVVWYYTV